MDFKEALDIASKCSVIVAVAVYLLQRRAIRLQHKRARYEKATQAILDLSRLLTPQSAAAQKLARYFDDSQIDNLNQGNPFDIPAAQGDLLLAALPGHTKPEEIPEKGDIRLTRTQSFQLRWVLISLLNSCEVVAQCWLTDVADRKTIEDELRSFLSDAAPGKNIMTTCRKIMNPKYYPALAALISELERQRSPNERPREIDQSLFEKIKSIFWR